MAEEGADQPKPSITPDQAIDAMSRELDNMMMGLFQESVPEGTAVMEEVRSDEGQIVDIRFTQGGNAATLKQVIPGKYTFSFVQASYAGHNRISDEVTVPRTGVRTSNDQYMTMLHEAGHTVDYENNKPYYDNLRLQLEPLSFALHLAKERIRSIAPEEDEEYVQARKQILEALVDRPQEERDGAVKKLLGDPDVHETREDKSKRYEEWIDKALEGYSDEQIQAAKQGFMNDFNNLTGEATLEQLKEYRDRIKNKIGPLEVQFRAPAERNAWAIAVKALRQLRSQGINLFTGSREELFRHIKEDSLGTYQNHLKEYTDDKFFFVRNTPTTIQPEPGQA